MFNLIVGTSRDAYAPGLGQRFHPCGHIDAVAIDPVPVLDDIAEVDAGSEFHSTVFGQFGIFGLQ